MDAVAVSVVLLAGASCSCHLRNLMTVIPGSGRRLIVLARHARANFPEERRLKSAGHPGKDAASPEWWRRTGRHRP